MEDSSNLESELADAKPLIKDSLDSVLECINETSHKTKWVRNSLVIYDCQTSKISPIEII